MMRRENGGQERIEGGGERRYIIKEEKNLRKR